MVIYCITNKINGKKYIGQTRHSIVKRFRRHCEKSQSNKKMPICFAIQKYGKDNFIIEEICKCSSYEEMNEKETYYAKLFNTFSPNGYNLRAGNAPGCTSEETRKKYPLQTKAEKPQKKQEKNCPNHIWAINIQKQQRKSCQNILKENEEQIIVIRDLLKEIKKNIGL